MENDIYKFSFLDFHLISVNFGLKTDKEYNIDKDIEISTNLTLRHDCQSGRKNVRLFMKVDICGEKLPFSLSLEGVGLFVFSKKIEDISSVDKVVRINCATIAFPYLREVVADIVRRSGLPQLNLPPINFVELYAFKSKAKTKELK
jgi:preprotein translocase subunit SecB